MHFYPRYIGDYARDTMSFGALEVGIYDLLLDHYYAHERALPLDMRELRQIARCSYARQNLNLERVLKMCFRKTLEGYVHDRAEKEIEKYKAKHDKAKRAADVRWGNADAPENDMQTHDASTCASDAIQNTEAIKKHKTASASKPQRSRVRARESSGPVVPPSAARGRGLPPTSEAADESTPAPPTSEAAEELTPSDTLDASNAGKLASALRYAGFAATPANPKVREAAMHGVTEATLALAIPHAIAEKQAIGEKANVGFVCSVAVRMHAQGLDVPCGDVRPIPLHAQPPPQQSNGHAPRFEFDERSKDRKRAWRELTGHNTVEADTSAIDVPFLEAKP